MRFKARLIPAEPAPSTLGGDIDLPDDLCELAARLQDDARLLAERFPADDPPVAMQPPGFRRANPLRFWTAAAALVAAVTVGGAAMLPWNAAITPNTQGHERRSASSPPHRDLHAIALPVHHPPDVLVSLDEPTAVPLQVLSSVTGPEREGLLDLLEVEADSGVGVSF